MAPLSAPMCKAARAILRMTQAELATASGVSVATLRRFEVDNTSSLDVQSKLLLYLEQHIFLIYNEADEIIGLMRKRKVEQGGPADKTRSTHVNS